MFFVRNRQFFFILTGVLLALSILAVAVFPPKLSIEFTGGSLLEVTYTAERPELSLVRDQVHNLALGEASVRESGEAGVTIRTRTLTEPERVALIGALEAEGAHALTVERFNTIGPSLGQELAIKTLYAILAVTFAIVLYIAWAFRGVSRPVPSWGYGLTTIFVLAIDIIVPTGFFAVYAFFTGAQVDTLFVIALLALLGYCVNDVIVIFDRVREHLKTNEEKNIKEDFDVTIGKSITETLSRSINTGLTIVFALAALAVIGSEATRSFALVMMVGVAAGTFSSIARSAPLLIPLASWLEKKRATKKANA